MDGFGKLSANRAYQSKNMARDRACKNLGVEDVGLYGGTKHTVATALGQLLSPEEIKRGGTGSKTNKAFDRYFQPQKREHVW